MVFDFLAAGQYKVILGKSFDAKPKKKAPKYFNVQNKVSSDYSGYGSEIKLEGKKKKVQVEMKHTDNPSIHYDAELRTEEEYDCILIYNEEKKTITLERQSAQINLVHKKVEPSTNGHLNHSPMPGNQYMSLHTPTPPPPIANHAVSPVAITPLAATASTFEDDDEDEEMEDDDFELDLSKGIDEILNSDNNKSDSESDTFEEIAAPTPIQHMTASPMNFPMTPTLPSSPNIPLNLALPTTPTAASALSPSTSTTTAVAAAAKKRKFKMASAPIRHPGFASPVTSASPVVSTTTQMRTGGKRPKTSHDSSSSGSEEDSSSGSESGSTETGSSSGESGSESGSDSDEDDDDFESLAQDISMSLSKGGPSAPASPQHHAATPSTSSPSSYKRSPYAMTPGHTPTPSTTATRQPPPIQQNGGAGPMSLRALFKEDDEEEGLSSSSDDDLDD